MTVVTTLWDVEGERLKMQCGYGADDDGSKYAAVRGMIFYFLPYQLFFRFLPFIVVCDDGGEETTSVAARPLEGSFWRVWRSFAFMGNCARGTPRCAFPLTFSARRFPLAVLFITR